MLGCLRSFQKKKSNHFDHHLHEIFGLHSGTDYRTGPNFPNTTSRSNWPRPCHLSYPPSLPWPIYLQHHCLCPQTMDHRLPPPLSTAFVHAPCAAVKTRISLRNMNKSRKWVVRDISKNRISDSKCIREWLRKPMCRSERARRCHVWVKLWGTWLEP